VLQLHSPQVKHTKASQNVIPSYCCRQHDGFSELLLWLF